jgi:hypothetical protein
VTGTTVSTLATVTLPAGSYLLTGKVNLTRTAGTGTSVCTVNDGATVLDQLGNQASTSGELTVLQTSVVLTASTPITLRCANSATTTNTTANFRVLTAYKLNTLTVQ